MAYIEVKQLQTADALAIDARRFLVVTIDADQAREAAVEWSSERGFCFRIHEEIARELCAALSNG